jgi:lysophospholipase L1-like esterase
MRASVFLLLLLLSGPAMAGEPFRILCIGDSITQGGRAGRPEYTYRLPLQRMLKALGREVDFIGTRSKGLDASPWPTDFDPDHQGYYGATTQRVAQELIAHLPSLPSPDVAIIHVGTNDAGRWDSYEAMALPLARMIQALRARNPRVVVLVADPGLPGTRGRLQRYVVENVVDRLSTQISPATWIEPPPRWGSADKFDAVHPNPRGGDRLAVQFLQELLARGV